MHELAELLGLYSRKSALGAMIKKASLKFENIANANYVITKENEGQMSEKIRELMSQNIITTKFLASDSPEEFFNTINPKIYMIDDFYDIVFCVENCYIKANKCVLAQRCKYFEGLISYNFQEGSQKIIKLDMISKDHFCLILQFIYTDFINLPNVMKDCEKAFYLLKWADYFMLSRLSEICSLNISELVNMKTVCKILLISYIYHAEKLLQFSSYYIAYQYFFFIIIKIEKW